jgi:hypothetical protein
MGNRPVCLQNKQLSMDWELVHELPKVILRLFQRDRFHSNTVAKHCQRRKHDVRLISDQPAN